MSKLCNHYPGQTECDWCRAPRDWADAAGLERDIVDVLRRAAHQIETGQADIINMMWVRKAADEIERLRAELAALVDAALAAEREACAGIAEAWGKRRDVMTDAAFFPGANHGERHASAGIAEAIRNRSTET